MLILGVGNLLLSDEGVGVHVAQQLQKMPIPPEVEVIDGGTGGFELIEHFRGKKKVIIVDALHADAEPGAVIRLTREDIALEGPPPFSAHQRGLQELLHFCQELEPPPEVIIYGIVPKQTQRMGVRLSKTVKRRLPEIISMVIDEAKQTAE